MARRLNDCHGHVRCDELLIRVSSALRDGRPGDRGFRIGGDEFALLLPKTDGDGALVRARRLVRVLADIDTTVSVGITSTSRDVCDEILRAQADAALGEARRHGGGQALCFEQTDRDVALASPEKRQALIQMIDEARVSTFYQPIWDLETATLLGLEALMRPDPELGFAGPAEAFDIAEHIDRVHPLDVPSTTSALQISPASRPSRCCLSTSRRRHSTWTLSAPTGSPLPSRVCSCHPNVSSSRSRSGSAVARKLSSRHSVAFAIARRSNRGT
jgi:predicted signal transduction protein with EAL and GGDEF domain